MKMDRCDSIMAAHTDSKYITNSHKNLYLFQQTRKNYSDEQLN